MNFISLFSGVGGADFGLERSGMTCVAQVENDPDCQKVLNKRWPEVPKLGDIHDVNGSDLPPTADLIWGSCPCQPHSVAGKRQGEGDDRNLWPEYLRIIKEYRSRYIVFENVPGIITTMLDKVLFDLESEAYTTTTFNLPACAFDANHKRERIYVVGYAEYPRRSPPKITTVITERKDGIEARKGKAIQSPRSSSERERVGRSRPRCRRWVPEPGLDRMVSGATNRVDKRRRVARTKALGNIVVPHVAEFIGYYIQEFDSTMD